MHILHIALGGCLRAPPVTYGLTSDTGGHIAYVLEAAQAQAARSDVSHVTIATRRFRDRSLGLIHDCPFEYVSDKVSIIRIGQAGAPYYEKEALTACLPELSDSLIAHVMKTGICFDIIHAHFADAATVGFALSRYAGIPVFYTPHALGIDKREAGGQKSAALNARIINEREAIRHANGLIVSTRDEAECQIPRYNVAETLPRIRSIAPGAPALASTTSLRGRSFLAPYLDNPDLPVILAVARPVKKKNLLHLAQCYAHNPDLQARCNLVILAGQHAGLKPGSEEHAVISDLTGLRDKSGLEGRFALPPSHNAGQVAGVYRHAARTGGVFVNPALHEPFGLTLLEAANAGLPVIATRKGGPADILAQIGHGLLVAPDRMEDLIAALDYILLSPVVWAHFSRSAQTRCTAFGWQHYAAESVAFYATCMRPADVMNRNDAVPVAPYIASASQGALLQAIQT